jgi:hypothetical protein
MLTAGPSGVVSRTGVFQVGKLLSGQIRTTNACASFQGSVSRGTHTSTTAPSPQRRYGLYATCPLIVEDASRLYGAAAFAAVGCAGDPPEPNTHQPQGPRRTVER